MAVPDRRAQARRRTRRERPPVDDVAVACVVDDLAAVPDRGLHDDVGVVALRLDSVVDAVRDPLGEHATIVPPDPHPEVSILDDRLDADVVRMYRTVIRLSERLASLVFQHSYLLCL